MRLEGKVALITGAAAGVEGELMGFGGASAHLFTREGAKVVLTDINEEMGQRTASQIRENGGDAIFLRPCYVRAGRCNRVRSRRLP